MTEIRYYHLENTPLERALPLLLQKTIERNWRAVVMTRSAERCEALNEALWTYDDRAFLPHGSAADGHADRQPVWITDSEENPNGATVLFLTDGAECGEVGSFELVCRLFDGRDEEARQAARDAWKTEMEAGYKVTYWQQTERGWEKKAERNG